MIKNFKILILVIILNFPFSIHAHVQHYESLNSIEFDIYRNNQHIGKHVFSFKRNNNQLEVESEIKFEIKKFGVVLYKYHVTGKEIYKDGADDGTGNENGMGIANWQPSWTNTVNDASNVYFGARTDFNGLPDCPYSQGWACSLSVVAI